MLVFDDGGGYMSDGFGCLGGGFGGCGDYLLPGRAVDDDFCRRWCEVRKDMAGIGSGREELTNPLLGFAMLLSSDRLCTSLRVCRRHFGLFCSHCGRGERRKI